jgi:hypothetical protein
MANKHSNKGGNTYKNLVFSTTSSKISSLKTFQDGKTS